jgi:hypothetical protein
MLITCPRCLTRYRLAEERVGGRLELDLLCSRCGFEFVLPRSEAAPEEAAAGAPRSGSETAGSGPGEECELLEKVPEEEAAAGREDEVSPAAGAGRGPSFLLLLACLLVLALALAAGYALWRGQLEELTGRLHLVDVCARTRMLPSGSRQVELSGALVNGSCCPVLDLQLAGILLDGAGRRRARAEVVKSLSREIPPGGRWEFELACGDCPAGISRYLVEISSVTLDAGLPGPEN